MLQGETHEATIYKNGNGTKVMLHTNRIYINDILFAIFRTTLTGKQTITSPLNKDHHATYHQGEASIPLKESIKVPAHFIKSH